MTSWEPAPNYVLLVGDATYDIYDFTKGPNKNLLPTYLVYTEFAGYVASDTWFTAPAGLVNGPNTLNIVRCPISRRGPIAWRIAG